MTEHEFPRSFLRNATTAELNAILSDRNDVVPPAAEKAILAEKDRRLSDPNSSEFRPTFM